jgi:hypothetical protein
VLSSKSASPIGRIADALCTKDAGALGALGALSSIDSASRASYTQGSILQAREAGKAVRIGRGPATVSG